MKQKKNSVSSSTLREGAYYFVSGMLVKRITRAVKECKLDITLACFLCKSTLRNSSVIGGHASSQQNYWAGQCSPPVLQPLQHH